jgi:hypothetical protein
MKGGPHLQQLWQKITTFNLDARIPQLASIKFMIEQGLFSDDLARDYLVLIEPMIQAAQDHPNALHRPPSQEELSASGAWDIELGTLVDAPDVRFGLRYLDRPRGALISGNSGSGKTNTFRVVINSMNELSRLDPERRVCLIVFDRKLDYVHLLEQLGNDWLHLSVHDSQTRLSLAAPVGLPANAWINLIASIFCARSGMVAAWTCFANMLRWLLAVLNPNPGPALRWPSLKLLLQVAQTAPLTLWAAKADYGKTMVGVLEAITQAMDTFDCFGGLDIERDVVQPGKNLLLEMPNVAPSWARQFMIDLVLAKILYGRIHRHQKIDRTAVAIVMDEADQDATAEADQRFPDQMSPLAQVLRLGREYGIMPMIGLGRLTGASPYVLSEPVYHLIFNQSDAASVLAARHTLLLPQAADMMFPALTPGTCIAREAQGPWPHPMLVKVDYSPPGRGPLPQSYDTHPIIPSQDLVDLPAVQKSLQELIAAQRQARLRQTKERGDSLSAHAHRLLHTAATHPWAPAATLWKLSGAVPPPATQISVHRELTEVGLAGSEEIRLGRANVLLYALTEKGWEYLHREPPKHVGRGSIAHQHISHWIELCGQHAGYQAHCERIMPGTSHPVDCAWETAGGVFDVFEVVVTSTGNVLQHLAVLGKCPAVGTITIVGIQKRQNHELQKQLDGAPVVEQLGARLCWELAETYLRRSFP